LEGLAFDFKSGLVGLEVLGLLISLGEQRLQVADLGDEGGADFGGELDVVDAIGGLVSNLSIRNTELGGGPCRLTLKLGWAD
jgi:hypothetical protein